MACFHEMFPDILFGKTVGSGHSCQLEVPEQIGAMVDRTEEIVTCFHALV